jgi:hypothetical protein
VTLRWGNLVPADYLRPAVIIESNVGRPPYPYKAGPDSYTLNLFEGGRYTIRARAFCQLMSKGEAITDYATVDGQDFSTSNATLTFAGGDCSRK